MRLITKEQRLAAYRNYSTMMTAKKVAGIDDTAELFAGTAPEFQATITRLAEVASLEHLAVYKLWRKYCDDCSNADQSAILWEFIQWYLKDLGGNKEALEAAIQ